MIKKSYKKIINFLKINIDYKKSYSQEGEDMILATIFNNRHNGFYVDIGAHHPIRFSNTNYFYQSGWRGINIDAMPGFLKLFKHRRKKDINIEIGVAEKEAELTYYIFNKSAMNTFSECLSVERGNLKGVKILDRIKIKTLPLAQILAEKLPLGQAIDFMNIDVEGFEIQVLRSNDWNKYIPKVIVLETYLQGFNKINQSDFAVFLNSQNYEIFSKSFYSVIFIHKDFMKLRLNNF